MRSSLAHAAVFSIVGLVGCARSPQAVGEPSTTPIASIAPPATPPSTSAAAAGSVATPKPNGPPYLSGRSQCDGLVLELTSTTPQPGAFAVEATLKNKGKTSLPLIATMDGSSFGRRNPTVHFQVTPSDLENPGLCGMMNRMTDADFITLAPGASRKLEWVHAPVPAHPGTYTLRATYTNDPQRSLTEDHNGEDKFVAKIKATVPCEVTSAPLTVTVK